MLLAEALAERAELQRRVGDLESRLNNVLLIQEGEEPAEDPSNLIDEYHEAQSELGTLIVRINEANNTANVMVGGNAMSLAQAVALRERAQRQSSFFHKAAQQANPTARGRYDYRLTRSEIPIRSSFPVPRLKEIATRHGDFARELDLVIQRANWETEV